MDVARRSAAGAPAPRVRAFEKGSADTVASWFELLDQSAGGTHARWTGPELRLSGRFDLHATRGTRTRGSLITHTHTNAQRSVRRAAFRMGAGASCGCAHMDARQHVPLMREEREREVVWLRLRTVLASVAARIRAVHELLRARQAVALTRVCTVVRFA